MPTGVGGAPFSLKVTIKAFSVFLERTSPFRGLGGWSGSDADSDIYDYVAPTFAARDSVNFCRVALAT